jgi:hypothetical protein
MEAWPIVHEVDFLTPELTRLEGAHMAQRTVDFKVNPAEETMRLGPLGVRILITGENSGGNIAIFEVVVPLFHVRSALRLPRIATTITKRRSTASTEC